MLCVLISGEQGAGNEIPLPARIRCGLHAACCQWRGQDRTGHEAGCRQAHLRSHGYEVSDKYILAMQSSDQDGRLEFCRIDDDIVLVLHYHQPTQEVRGLSLIFFPEDQTSKTNRLSRGIHEMRFEDDGVYTVRMRRKAGPEKAE